MKKVKIHKNAGILSAYGLVLADVVVEKQAPVMKAIQSHFSNIEGLFSKLEKESVKHLVSQGFKENEVVVEKILHMRYHKTDAIIMCSDQEGMLSTKDHFVEEFGKQYMREFGFTIPDREIIVDDVRLEYNFPIKRQLNKGNRFFQRTRNWEKIFIRKNRKTDSFA